MQNDHNDHTEYSRVFDLGSFVKLPYSVFPSLTPSISVLPDPKYGGAHQYAIQHSLGFDPVTQQAIEGQQVSVLTFVHKPEGDAPMEEGVQSEQLAYVLLDRLDKLNAVYPSPQAEKMRAGLLMFIEACEERVTERMKRGVMGELKK